MKPDPMTEEIRRELYSLQDLQYRDLQIRTIPTVKPESIIGVRTPELRRMARELAGREGTAAFTGELPHRYFEENQLHAFLISGMKDFRACLTELERFLPYVDNWATCDQMSPKVFRNTGRSCWPASGNGLPRRSPIRSGSASAC